MPYRLKTGEPLQEGIRRVVSEQVERALGELADTSLDRATTIHQVRKRCKKVRGALRLVRSGMKTYPEENAWYRDAASTLSDARDAEALIETCDALSKKCSGEVDAATMHAIRARLQTRRDTLMEDEDRISECLREFEAAMVEGLERASSLRIDDEGYDTALAGLRKSYARARAAMQAAFDEPSAKSFHEWRKRVKYHGYHVRLLREAWPTVMKARREETDALGHLLGNHHNLCVLRDRVMEDPVLSANEADLDEFSRCIDQHTAKLEKASQPMGGRLLAEKPKHLERRFAEFLRVWSKEA